MKMMKHTKRNQYIYKFMMLLGRLDPKASWNKIPTFTVYQTETLVRHFGWIRFIFSLVDWLT